MVLFRFKLLQIERIQKFSDIPNNVGLSVRLTLPHNAAKIIFCVTSVLGRALHTVFEAHSRAMKLTPIGPGSL